MKRNLGLGILLGLVLLLPTIQAESVTGSLLIRAAAFPAQTETTLEPEAAIIQDTERVDALALSAASLRVTFFEMRLLSAPIPFAPAIQTGTVPRSFTVTSATVTKAPDGDQSGYLGLYPGPSATLRVTGSEATTAEPSSVSTLQADGNWTPDAASQWWYSQHVEGPHVLYATQGGAAFDGPGSFKLYGPDVTIQGAENDTPETFRTGLFQDDALHYRQAWLVIEADAANLNVEGSAPIKAATKAPARLAWDGAATIEGATGTLTADGAIYTATDETATLDGAFSALLAPESADAATMQASGDLRGTNLAAVPVPVSPIHATSGAWAVGLALVLVGAVVGGAAFALHKHRQAGIIAPRLAEPTDSAAYFDHYATLAVDLNRADLALEWIRAARASGHDSAHVATWEGMIHHNRGNTDAALECFADAARLDPESGDADCWAAVALAKRNVGYDKDAALEHLWRALQRDPMLAEDVRDDPAFSILHGTRFNALVAQAIERCEREGRRLI